jgi:hypothetical protein
MMPRLNVVAPVVSLVVLVLSACTSPNLGTSQSPGSAASQPEQRTEQSRTLVMVARRQPNTLAGKEALQVTGLSFSRVPCLFNAELAIFDGPELPRPYLVEHLPELNSDTWRVLPDGRMETICRLRPNLARHDGTPLTGPQPFSPHADVSWNVHEWELR